MVAGSPITTSPKQSRSRPRRLRFPCGHTEAEPAIFRRLRGTDDVVWVGCQRCNVVAVAFMTSHPAPAARGGGR